jgi:hypothetical protein
MDNNKLLEEIDKKISKLSLQMEMTKVRDYVEMMQNPKRMLLSNFLGGLARGFGMAIGFTLLGAVVLYILQRVMILNLPIIGEFIAELVKIVQTTLNLRP